MTYNEVTEYLFTRTPLFQNVGKDAYKEGLSNTLALDEHFGHPHLQFKTIHVAGTNGKGSCSHTIASILQEAGYKVGLYTSPHLIDFRERIRINGDMIPEKEVIRFVEEEKDFFEPLYPSFFELSTAMAFRYFAEQKVDIAVIEVGLGGRLDCTNIITPIASIITNISFDHVQFLGDTLGKIASEKAGIIKRGVPAIIGETVEETRPVFQSKANKEKTEIIFAEDSCAFDEFRFCEDGGIDYDTHRWGTLHAELCGECQTKNTNTILNALDVIEHELEHPFTKENIINGFANVCKNTGLMGRWQKLNNSPQTICDTGHNVAGFSYITSQLAAQDCGRMHIVFGMVNDKDISSVLEMMPKDATYYFCQASVKRALDHTEIKEKAHAYGLHGDSFPTVWDAYQAAVSTANDDDFIYIGGSSFVVADLLKRMSES